MLKANNNRSLNQMYEMQFPVPEVFWDTQFTRAPKEHRKKNTLCFRRKTESPGEYL
jgi:hypothetical protein